MTGFDKTSRSEGNEGGNTNGIDYLRSEYNDYPRFRLPTKFERNKGLSIEDIGQVKQLNLPSNWAPAETATSSGTDTFKSYADKENPDAKLCFYYRGERLDRQSAERFNSLLKQPEHALSRSELQALSQVTRSRYGNPQDFALYSASTTNVNGKRILAVEGRFVARQIDTRAMYFDADGNGAIQEIYYQGPKDAIDTMVQARKAMKNIEWK